MAIKLNLLPSEKRVGKDLQRILRTIRMLGVVGLGIFIIFGIVLIGFFVFRSIQLNTRDSQNSGLKSRISTLETSETKMVLLKDRIAKIKTLLNVPTALANLDNVNLALSSLASDTTINELNISTAKISLSLNFKNSNEIAVFLKSLSDTKAFKTVTISSFSFNPTSGYLISIVITGT